MMWAYVPFYPPLLQRLGNVFRIGVAGAADPEDEVETDRNDNDYYNHSNNLQAVSM